MSEHTNHTNHVENLQVSTASSNPRIPSAYQQLMHADAPSPMMENINLIELANTYGTPLYVYSTAAIVAQFNAYKHQALPSTHIHYAVKANSNLSILKTLHELGAHFDVVSMGELKRVLAIGCPAEHVVFAGVGKSQDELMFALQQGVKCFNVESIAELIRLQNVAEQLNLTARISLRINPNVDAKTHPYISTGLKENKFGIAFEDAIISYQAAHAMPNLEIVGIDCHIGSQITQTAPFFEALDRLLEIVESLRLQGIYIQHVDVGGGLGINYLDAPEHHSGISTELNLDIENPAIIGQYVAKLQSILQAKQLTLMLEPGRSIIGNAGVLLTRVEYLKPGMHKNFCVVDAGMNDLIRPTLYQAYHHVLNLNHLSADLSAAPHQSDNDFNVDATQASATHHHHYDIVGPVCESGDWLAKNRSLPNVSQGDVLALLSAGAYGFTMSSNYNTRPRAAEVLVDGNCARLIHPRESIESLYQTELDFLV